MSLACPGLSSTCFPSFLTHLMNGENSGRATVSQEPGFPKDHTEQTSALTTLECDLTEKLYGAKSHCVGNEAYPY